jgi:hypothetical protein
MKSAWAVGLLIGLVSSPATAQSPAPPPGQVAVVTDSGSKQQTNPLRGQTPASRNADNAELHRWFDLQSAQAETRYRFVETSAGDTAANQWQHKESIKGAFKFDALGHYSVQAFLGTGNGFTGSWDPTGVGTGAPTWDFRVRRLYAQAVPVKGLELAAGSFDVLRGETSEITSYDNDAFMQGYRASIKRPAEFFFDELSVTAGYLGDLSEPNVFSRFKWMDTHNYTQALVGKRLGKQLAVSVDWTSVNHVDTVREGVRLGAKHLVPRMIDDVRLEFYQRADSPSGQGFSLDAERFFSKTVMAYAGYAHVDKDNGALNGDRYARGQRAFVGGSINILPELMLSTFYTHAFANDFPISNNQRFDLILSYNVLKALQEHHAW